MRGRRGPFGHLQLTTKAIQFHVFDSVETAEGTARAKSVYRRRPEAWAFFDLRTDGIPFPNPAPNSSPSTTPSAPAAVAAGFGRHGIDPERVVPDPKLSIYDDAIACWREERMGKWRQRLCLAAQDNDIPIHSVGVS